MILIVEDNIEINNLIRDALSGKGYNCKQAFSGTEAILLFGMETYEIVILDLMLPGMSGEEVLKKYREKYDSPVLVVTAKSELDSKMNLYELGADDYITKPFEIAELVARVGVWLKRTGKGIVNSNNTIELGEMTIDKSNFEVKINGENLSLTRQEYKIVELLMFNTNKVYTKQEIYEYAWDEYYVGVDKTINVHISNIRNKIKKLTEAEFIETVWGIGFKGKNQE